MTTPTIHHPLRDLFHSRGTTTDRATTVESYTAASTAGPAALAVTRVGLGFVFLWAFLDKTFGLGYATQSAKSWLNGGSPTKGFLSSVSAGPLASTFHDMAGKGWVDWLFMVGLLGIGIALLLGVALRPAAVAGVIMMALMWAAEWPPAKHGASGLTGSTNPFVDYHVVYALAFVALAALSAGRYWGLGDRWSRLPIVQHQPWLR